MGSEELEMSPEGVEDMGADPEWVCTPREGDGGNAGSPKSLCPGEGGLGGIGVPQRV